MNLLQETIETLMAWEHKPEDVRWVGSKDGEYAISFDEFSKVADVEYNAGYGEPEVAQNLVVVGDDWWLERVEHLGSEEWVHKCLPTRMAEVKTFSRAVILEDQVGWKHLDEVN